MAFIFLESNMVVIAVIRATSPPFGRILPVYGA
jgi:hypothetical protein